MVGNLSKKNKPAVTRSATIKVAASNATAKSKAAADYVCDGVGDHVEINAAIQELAGVGGSVELSEGTFNTTANITFTDVPNATLRGQGEGTLINYDGSPSSHAIVNLSSSIFMADLKINSNQRGVKCGSTIAVHNCTIISRHYGVEGISDLQYANISNSRIESSAYGMYLGSAGWIRVIGCHVTGTTYGIFATSSRLIIMGNNINKFRIHGSTCFPSTTTLIADTNDISIGNIQIS